MLLALSASVAIAQSVVQPKGNTPRFPNAYKRLAAQTKPHSVNGLLDANVRAADSVELR